MIYLNPLSPNSDENEISLYIITTCLSIQVMRTKKVIIKGTMYSSMTNIFVSEARFSKVPVTFRALEGYFMRAMFALKTQILLVLNAEL